MNRRRYLAAVAGGILSAGCLSTNPVPINLTVVNRYEKQLNIFVEILESNNEVLKRKFVLDTDEYTSQSNIDSGYIGDKYVVNAGMEDGPSKSYEYQITCRPDEGENNIYVAAEWMDKINISQSVCNK